MSPLVLLAHFTIIKSKLIEKDWPIKSTYLMIQNNDRRCSRVPKRSVRQVQAAKQKQIVKSTIAIIVPQEFPCSQRLID